MYFMRPMHLMRIRSVLHAGLRAGFFPTRPCAPGAAAQRAAGFTILEVLVALAIGFIGLFVTQQVLRNVMLYRENTGIYARMQQNALAIFNDMSVVAGRAGYGFLDMYDIDTSQPFNAAQLNPDVPPAGRPAGTPPLLQPQVWLNDTFGDYANLDIDRIAVDGYINSVHPLGQAAFPFKRGHEIWSSDNTGSGANNGHLFFFTLAPFTITLGKTVGDPDQITFLAGSARARFRPDSMAGIPQLGATVNFPGKNRRNHDSSRLCSGAGFFSIPTVNGSAVGLNQQDPCYSWMVYGLQEANTPNNWQNSGNYIHLDANLGFFDEEEASGTPTTDSTVAANNQGGVIPSSTLGYDTATSLRLGDLVVLTDKTPFCSLGSGLQDLGYCWRGYGIPNVPPNGAAAADGRVRPTAYPNNTSVASFTGNLTEVLLVEPACHTNAAFACDNTRATGKFDAVKAFTRLKPWNNTNPVGLAQGNVKRFGDWYPRGSYRSASTVSNARHAAQVINLGASPRNPTYYIDSHTDPAAPVLRVSDGIFGERNTDQRQTYFSDSINTTATRPGGPPRDNGHVPVWNRGIPLASNIVNMKVQYLFLDGRAGDRIAQGYQVTGAGAPTYTADSDFPRHAWQNVYGVRIALVARSETYEKTEVTQSVPIWRQFPGGLGCAANTGGNPDNCAYEAPGHTTTVLNGAQWLLWNFQNNSPFKHYRYQVYEMIIPIPSLQSASNAYGWYTRVGRNTPQAWLQPITP